MIVLMRQPSDEIRMAMAVAGWMMAHQVAGKASRGTIFLSPSSLYSHLPVMVTVCVQLRLSWQALCSRTLVRLGPQRIARVAFALSSLLQLGEWLLLGYRAHMAACIIYVHAVAFGAVLMSGFWSVMNETFEPRLAKDLFGRISGIGTLGGLCGGLLAERVAAWFGCRMSSVLAALHMACAGLPYGGHFP